MQEKLCECISGPSCSSVVVVPVSRCPSGGLVSSHTPTLQDFACPICMELLYSPRTPLCGHTFCSHCYEQWCDHSDGVGVICPVDRTSLSSTIPSVNILLQSLIQICFPVEYAQRAQVTTEQFSSYLKRELRYIFSHNYSNALMVKILKSDEHGYLEDEDVIRAMLLLPRPEFVPPSLRSSACELRPSRIEGLEFNVSAPNMYTFCLDQLKIQKGQKVLDIGSGCGLFTALAAQLVGSSGLVHGIEIKDNIIRFAQRNVAIQKRRYQVRKSQRLAYESDPSRGLFVPGSTFSGSWWDLKSTSTKYPVKLHIDTREEDRITGRLYWQQAGRTITYFEGTLSSAKALHSLSESETSTMKDSDSTVKVELKELSTCVSRLDVIDWFPAAYTLLLDASSNKLTGTSKAETSGVSPRELELTHSVIFTDEVYLDCLSYHKVNCFHIRRKPLCEMISGFGGYDRIHCGATCPEELLPRLTKLLAVGGRMVVPVDSNLTVVSKDSAGHVTISKVLPVHYGHLEVPENLEDEDPSIASPTSVSSSSALTLKKRKINEDGSSSFEAENDSGMPEQGLTASSSEEPFAFYSSCCGLGVIKNSHLIPEESVVQTVGEVLQLTGKAAHLCLQAFSVVEDEEFTYFSAECLHGTVRHVRCAQCGLHVGIRFVLAEPEDRGDPSTNGGLEESYLGKYLLVKPYFHPTPLKEENFELVGVTSTFSSVSTCTITTSTSPTSPTSPSSSDLIKCKSCNTTLAFTHHVVSTQHRWKLESGEGPSFERAAFLNWISSNRIVLGDKKQVKVNQGTSKYSPVYCKQCHSELGWKFVGHVYCSERNSLSWLNGRYGLVCSRVTGIQVTDRGLNNALADLMRQLALAGLLQLQALASDSTDTDNADGNEDSR